MVTNVTSLLKTVKAVEDEATRGTRALEAAIECIKQELTVSTSHRPKLLFMVCSESNVESQLLCEAVFSKRISVYYSEENRGAFCSLFLYYTSSSFPSTVRLNPCRFPTALIRVGMADTE